MFDKIQMILMMKISISNKLHITIELHRCCLKTLQIIHHIQNTTDKTPLTELKK